MTTVDKNILEKIVAAKNQQISACMRHTPLEIIREAAVTAPPPRDFTRTLTNGQHYPVIAEIKKRSPSKGLLCSHFVPATIAQNYAAGNAACLSVLTDQEFFGGCNDDLKAVRDASSLPVLRKDFMLNEWQIFESRSIGADAVLLIAAVLSLPEMLRLAETAHALKMAVLAEVHDARELEQALTLPPYVLIGINNRNLKTFVTDIQTTLALMPAVRKQPVKRLLISESGIHHREDIVRLQQAGVDGFLIGEALMQNPQAALKRLFE